MYAERRSTRPEEGNLLAADDPAAGGQQAVGPGLVPQARFEGDGVLLVAGEVARRDGGLPKTVLARARKSALAKSAFVPVRVTDDEAVNGDGRVEIVLAGKRRVRVNGPVDRQMLGDVLAVLEGQGG